MSLDSGDWRLPVKDLLPTDGGATSPGAIGVVNLEKIFWFGLLETNEDDEDDDDNDSCPFVVLNFDSLSLFCFVGDMKGNEGKALPPPSAAAGAAAEAPVVDGTVSVFDEGVGGIISQLLLT